MNKIFKKCLLFILTFVLILNISAYAEEIQPTEEETQLTEEEVSPTEEALPDEAPIKFFTTVTLSLGNDEFIFTYAEDDSILSIESTTETGQLLLEDTDLTDLSLIESIDTLAAISDESTQEMSLFVLSSDESTLNLLEEVLSTTYGDIVDSALEELIIDEQPAFIQERFKLAEELSITPGKMNLIQKLEYNTGEKLDYSQWANASVQAIMMEIKNQRTLRKPYGDIENVEMIKTVIDDVDDNEAENTEVKDAEVRSNTSNKGNKVNKGKAKGKNK